jgi:hypothetical protein
MHNIKSIQMKKKSMMDQAYINAAYAYTHTHTHTHYNHTGTWPDVPQGTELSMQRHGERVKQEDIPVIWVMVKGEVNLPLYLTN